MSAFGWCKDHQQARLGAGAAQDRNLPNVRVGSFVCIRVGSKLGRFSGGDPTFDPQGRQSGGEQT